MRAGFFKEDAGSRARPIRGRGRLGCEALESRTLLSTFAPSDQSHWHRPHLVHALTSRGESASWGDAGPIVSRDIVYRVDGGQAEALDVYRPSGPAPAGGWPVVVAIHGGGWTRLDKDGYGPKVAPLTRFGFAVVVPDYRLSTPTDPSWPVNFEDVQAAVRWVRQNAGPFGFDPGRVAAMGESAGGHLALMLGTDAAGASAVGAVVDFFGPADLTRMVDEGSLGRPRVISYLGGTPDQIPDLYAAASPLTHIASGDPPTLILQGTADTTVFPDQSEELAQALSAHEVPNRLILIDGAGHGFGFRAGGRDLLPTIAGFLDRSLGVSRNSDGSGP